MTLFALLFFIALSGSCCFALGRTFGRGERYEKGYREGFRDGETGSLARAARLVKINDEPRLPAASPTRGSIAPVVESMLVPSTVPAQLTGLRRGTQLAAAGRMPVPGSVSPAVAHLSGRHHRAV